MEVTTLLIAFATIFATIFFAELGDKTQLMVISLSTKYRKLDVFVGAILGFTIVNGVTIFIGCSLSEFTPDFVTLIGGIIFIIFGIATIITKGSNDEEEKVEKQKEKRGIGLISSFSLVFLAELGDKTQIASLILAITYKAFLEVFLSVILSLGAVTIIGIIVGRSIKQYIKPKPLRILSGSLFIILGILTILL